MPPSELIDVIVLPTPLLEVFTGVPGEPGPPGPQGIPGTAELPPAPLGQVIISQGLAAQPIFSGIVTINRLTTTGAITAAGGLNTANGSVTAYSLSADQLQIHGRTFDSLANLAGMPAGIVTNISDSTTDIDGDVIAGGGTKSVLARYDGAVWRVVGSATPSSAASLPTAPVGQVLTSQGDDVPPVFSPAITLINPAAPSGNRRWALHIADDHLALDSQSDAGVSYNRPLRIGLYDGGVVSMGGGSFNGAVASWENGVHGKYIAPREAVFAAMFTPLPYIGALATISDSPTNIDGDLIAAGGGTHNVLARWDGSNWRVLAGVLPAAVAKTDKVNIFNGRQEIQDSTGEGSCILLRDLTLPPDAQQAYIRYLGGALRYQAVNSIGVPSSQFWFYNGMLTVDGGAAQSELAFALSNPAAPRLTGSDDMLDCTRCDRASGIALRAKSFVMQPGSRAYTLTSYDAGGVMQFRRSDTQGFFSVGFSSDVTGETVQFAGRADQPAIPVTLNLASGQAPIVLTTAEAGGSYPVQIGRRLLDSNAGVGATVEIWPCTGVTTPPLTTKTPGGASDTWGVLHGGQMFMTEVPAAQLPATPPMGTLANVSDSMSEITADPVVGGGTFHVLARWNGTTWKVVA